jgi:beta-N-acetylhexosaminidase
MKRKTRSLSRLLLLIMMLALFEPLFTARASQAPQQTPLEAQAQELLEKMSPEERVGQLFLLTFTGDQIGADTQIYDLIANHHIGGVILMASNDNFSSGETKLSQILEMNRQLQANRWAAVQSPRFDPASGQEYSLNYIPLFIGISQEGDGYPYDQILSGLTTLPDEMAMGATWNPGLATKVGNVLGKELSTLGFNLLLGPSLDVLERPRPEDISDLGTRTFGGDPFWVGVMGNAYIQGVHQGSEGRMAVIAKHFPGNGGADRLPEEEVSTVRKNFEQLKNFDLKPFFAVTGGALTGSLANTGAAADGLLASHIRYQGFAENIRQTTRPVSFDKDAFDKLMALPDLSAWRENGGIMISDNLGSMAVRRFYETTGQTYDARLVALNAFKAGNDLLYLGDVTSGEDADSYTTTLNILSLFAQKYRNDPAFVQEVNESVLRILTQKLSIYPSFNLNEVLPSQDGIISLGQSSHVTYEVASRAATLISPPLDGLEDAIPVPPNLSDRIVFITDARSYRQCTLCEAEPALGVGALEEAVVRLYGPQGDGQILPTSLHSFSTEDLLAMLDGPRNTTPIETELRRANWLVFGMLNVSADLPTSQALQRFLSERPDLFQGRRLVVFAFNAPYYLDATDISKISAYFGMYSKSSSFVEVAARLLFRELTPQGALPVSVPGVGYDLIAATSPDPDQVIPLFFETNPPQIPPDTGTPEPAVVPEFRLGDAVKVSTGVILDHNGHSVPDGTPVQFIQTVNGETSFLPQTETRGGVASASIQANSSGEWSILAESEPAKSNILFFNIPSETGEIVTITPTITPTETPEPTLTPTAPPPVTPTPEPPSRTHPDLADWFMAIMLTGIAGLSTFRLAALIGQVRWGVRGGFLALIGGLLSYSFLALGLPGSEKLLENWGAWGVILITLLGCGLGIAAAWAWRAMQMASTALKT